MRFALALILSALPLPALAEDCVYRHAGRDDFTVKFADSRHFAWLSQGGKTEYCTIEDNRLPRGPYPTTCVLGDRTADMLVSFFPSPDGELDAVMVFNQAAWYRECE